MHNFLIYWCDILPASMASFSRRCWCAMNWRWQSLRWTSGSGFVWVSFVL